MTYFTVFSGPTGDEPPTVQAPIVKTGGMSSTLMVNVVEAVPGFPAPSRPLTVKVYAPLARPE